MRFALLAVAAVFVVSSCFGQPHPYTMQYEIRSEATCKDGCKYALSPISVCLLLQYFPEVCQTAPFQTKILNEGGPKSIRECDNAWINAKINTTVSLQALNAGLPQEDWALNWTSVSYHPLLPVVAHGLPNTSPPGMSLKVPCGSEENKCSCHIWAKQTAMRLVAPLKSPFEDPTHNTAKCGNQPVPFPEVC